MLYFAILILCQIDFIFTFHGYPGCGKEAGRRGGIGGTHSTGHKSSTFFNPWSVAIVLPKDDGNDSTKLHCSGSILSPKFVLTAAHCFYSEYGPVSETNMVLIVGASQPTNQTALAIDKTRRLSQSRKIKKVLIHPSFNTSTVSAMYDLALVEIQGSFTFKKSIWPICVPNAERPREHHFMNGYKLVGFGTDISDSDQCSECLKSDQLNVKTTVYCNTIYGQILKTPSDSYYDVVKTALPNNFDDDPLICAKVTGQTSGTCPGDSGGILYTHVFSEDEGEIAVQQAVVRGSIRDCDGTRFPSIFNRLDNKKVLPWLKDIVFDEPNKKLRTTEIKKLKTDLAGAIRGKEYETASKIQAKIDDLEKKDNEKILQGSNQPDCQEDDGINIAKVGARTTVICQNKKNDANKENGKTNPDKTNTDTANNGSKDSSDETQPCADYESDGYKCVPINDCEGMLSVRSTEIDYYNYEDSSPTCSDPSQTCCHQERMKEDICEAIHVTGDNSPSSSEGGLYLPTEERASDAPNNPVWKMIGEERFIFNTGSSHGWRVGPEYSLADGSYYCKGGSSSLPTSSEVWSGPKNCGSNADSTVKVKCTKLNDVCVQSNTRDGSEWKIGAESFLSDDSYYCFSNSMSLPITSEGKQCESSGSAQLKCTKIDEFCQAIEVTGDIYGGGEGGLYVLTDERASATPNSPVWKNSAGNRFIFTFGNSDGWRIGPELGLTDGQYYCKGGSSSLPVKSEEWSTNVLNPNQCGSDGNVQVKCTKIND